MDQEQKTITIARRLPSQSDLTVVGRNERTHGAKERLARLEERRACHQIQQLRRLREFWCPGLIRVPDTQQQKQINSYS
jgi:hypothetical protein